MLHVHSAHSDGTGTPDEITMAARGAGLSFVGMNDHRNLSLREAGFSGLRNGVFLLTGTELENGRRQNHLLAYGIDRLPRTKETREQLLDIRDQGGIGIAAHPRERGGLLPGAGSYRWPDEIFEDLSGVEVWNYMSAWKRGISPLNFLSRVKRPDPLAASPDPEAVDLWLRTGGCALACPDAHALRPGGRILRLEVFPYAMLFRRLRTHVLLESEPDWEDTGGTERSIVEALRTGRVFCSNGILGDAAGFRAVREGGRLELELPGDGSVFLHTAGGREPAGHAGAGRCTLEAGAGPVLVTVEREEGTWIVCGCP